MSAQLASLALGLVAALSFAALISMGVAIAWPWLRARLAGAHPAVRARGVWLAAIAPGALPVLLVALCFLPGLLAAAGLGHDHCTQHPEHAHLCLTHASLPLTRAGAGLLALAALLLGAALAPEAASWLRTRRWLAGLTGRSSRFGRDVTLVESPAPFAFAAGWLRPRVYLTARLAEALPPPQLAAVVEHERAHARRRDPIARLVARVLSRAHLPRVRRQLLAELAFATESACDAEAGRRIGDRLAVAEAILAVERLLGASAPAPAGVTGFDGNAVVERVSALLASEPPAPPRIAWRIAFALAAIGAFASVDSLHHLTEHLLALASRLF
jgi:Zn-dependent protease with chaperone function